MIRLTQNSKRRQKSIEVPFSQNDWNASTQSFVNVKNGNTPEYKKYRSNLSWLENTLKKYQDIIDQFIFSDREFTFDMVFDALIDGKVSDLPKQVYALYEHRIKELKADDRLSTANRCKYSMGRMKTLFKRDMLFHELTPEKVMQFRRHMENSGRMGTNTIQSVMSNLRSHFNYAIEYDIARLGDYPFRKKSIMRGLTPTGASRPITHAHVDAIRELSKKLSKGPVKDACQYFMFGYLGKGINFTDIARLRWVDMENGRIRYVRTKTKGLEKGSLSIKVSEEVNDIITYFGNSGSEYIFPILGEIYNTESMKQNRIKKIRKVVNKDLKEVGKLIDSPIPLTSLVWRHTFATVAVNVLGNTTHQMQVHFGHKNITTTQRYIGQFDDDRKDELLVGL